MAVFAGVAVHPAVSYTVGAAMMGVAWAVLLIVCWRTRPRLSIIATVILVLGLSMVRDSTFPGTGFLRGIYGGAVAFAAGMLFFRLFRRPILHFCRLDHHDPNDDDA